MRSTSANAAASAPAAYGDEEQRAGARRYSAPQAAM